MSDLYTFSFTFKKGNTNTQIEAESLKDAISLWIDKDLPTVYGISSFDLKNCSRQIREQNPFDLGNLINAWFVTFQSGSSHGCLTIIKTCKT